MIEKCDEAEFDSQLRQVLGAAPRPNFEAWRSAHQTALAELGTDSEVVNSNTVPWSRRRLLSLSLALAASFLVAMFIWPFSNKSSAYAQTIPGIDQVKQLTWTVTVYIRYTSQDGQRTWIQKEEILNAFRAPGLFRETRLGSDGQVVRVATSNAQTRQTLLEIPSEKKAVLKAADSNITAKAPFEYIGKIIREQKSEGEWLVRSVKLMGEMQLDGRNANMVRAVLQSGASRNRSRSDFFFDLQSKALLGVWAPNDPADDFESFPDLNNPKEQAWSKMMPIAALYHKIEVDSKLTAVDFSLDPQSGYSLEKLMAPTISEEDMLAYLRAVAEFQDCTLPETIDHSGVDREKLDASYAEPETSRSKEANAMINLVDKFRMREIYEPPMVRFVRDQTEPDSFHYVGSGIKLGSAEEIVCWYRLKGASRYRAVYGDLQVRDVQLDDLPLVAQ
jgi:hypothetical protein